MLKLHEHTTNNRLDYGNKSELRTMFKLIVGEGKTIQYKHAPSEALAIHKNEQEIFRLLYGDIVNALQEVKDNLVDQDDKTVACVQAWKQLDKVLEDIQKSTIKPTELLDQGEQTDG